MKQSDSITLDRGQYAELYTGGGVLRLIVDHPSNAPLIGTCAAACLVRAAALMVYDRGSPKTQGLYVPVAQGILAIEPATPRQIQIYAEMLKALDAVSETRDRRLNSLTLGLPGIYWQVVLFSVLMVVLVSSTIEQTPFRIAILASQAAVLGAFVGFVFLMDSPFKGTTGVDASSIAQVIARMEARTK